MGTEQILKGVAEQRVQKSTVALGLQGGGYDIGNEIRSVGEYNEQVIARRYPRNCLILSCC